MSAALYYYADSSNKPMGPLTLTQLRALAEKNAIKPNTKVIRKGSKAWIPYSKLSAETRSSAKAADTKDEPSAVAEDTPTDVLPPKADYFRSMPKPVFFGLIGALGCLIGGLLGELWLLPFKGGSKPEGVTTTGSEGQSAARQLMVFSPEIQKRLESADYQKGAIEIALAWENTDDLDLHCIDPTGTEIYYGNRGSPPGGWLDVDMNVVSPYTAKPVEHIVWGEGNAPLGEYKIIVEHFATRLNNPLPTEFIVALKINGQISEFKRKAHAKERVEVHTFKITEKDRESVVGGSSAASMLDALVLGIWTALLAVCLALALLAGQNHLMNRPLPNINAAMPVVIGGAIAGLVSGGASQFVFAVLEQTLTSWLPTWTWLSYLGRILGWMLLGGILGAGMGWFIPNLPRTRAAMAGVLGGLIGGIAFLVASGLIAETLGRLMGVIILGLAIGLMVALIEQLTRRAWLEVHWSRNQSSTINLGETPVTIGGGKDDIRVPGIPEGTLSLALSGGRLTCTRQPGGQESELKDQSAIKLGRIRLIVHAKKEE